MTLRTLATVRAVQSSSRMYRPKTLRSRPRGAAVPSRNTRNPNRNTPAAESSRFRRSTASAAIRRSMGRYQGSTDGSIAAVAGKTRGSRFSSGGRSMTVDPAGAVRRSARASCDANPGSDCSASATRCRCWTCCWTPTSSACLCWCRCCKSDQATMRSASTHGAYSAAAARRHNQNSGAAVEPRCC